MSKLNLVWAEGLYFSDGAGMHCRTLGYLFETFAFGTAGFRAYGTDASTTDASTTDSFEIELSAPTMEAAQLCVEVWLTAQIAGVLLTDRYLNPIKVASASNSEFVEGTQYAQKFADVVPPLLAPDSPVVVSPTVTSEGFSGLYFENKATGMGVKVMHCSKPGLVVMFWGTRAELEFAWSREPSYFEVEEISHYANVAVQSYLT